MFLVSEFYEFINSMGVAIPDLIANKKSMYHVEFIPKPNGKQRKICEPLGVLRDIQEFILAKLNNQVLFRTNVCAYIPGRGLKEHLKAHAPADFLLAVDIKDFFPSCHPILIEKTLGGILQPGPCIRDIVNLCTLDNGLPQGAPTSPILSNIVLKEFDSVMHHFTLATKAPYRGLMYTRYADDILFSAHGNRASAKDFAHEMLEFIEKNLYNSCYMYLNHKKTQLIVRNDNRLLISNKFVVYNSGEVALTKKYRGHIEGQLFHFARDRKPLSDHMLGKLSWVRHINMAQYCKLIRDYNLLVDKSHYGRQV